MKPALCLAALALSLAACSSQWLQDNQQAWREDECVKIIDTPRRERCLKEARQ